MSTSIYIMGSAGCHKIGIAADPRARKAQLQTGNPEFVGIQIVTAPTSKRNARDIERRCHEILASSRRRGEWFGCDLADAIDALLLAVEEYRFRLGLKTAAQIDQFTGIVRC